MESCDPHWRMLCALEPRMARMGSDGPTLIIRDYPLDPRLIHLRFMGSIHPLSRMLCALNQVEHEQESQWLV
jgi:hypothetical protein